MTQPEFKVGDEVSWMNASGSRGVVSCTRYEGRIREINDGVAVCRRGKNGKVDHHVPLGQLHPKSGDPLRSFVSLMRDAYAEREKKDGDHRDRPKRKPRPKKRS